jgi:hypothetical protein
MSPRSYPDNTNVDRHARPQNIRFCRLEGGMAVEPTGRCVACGGSSLPSRGLDSVTREEQLGIGVFRAMCGECPQAKEPTTFRPEPRRREQSVDLHD